MRPIDRSEILPIGEYELVRPHFRARVIEDKRARRVNVGAHMTAVFENRDTVLLQIQEMLRTERITNEAGLKHELDTYNELIPEAGQLSMTLFVEVADRGVREKLLEELAGLEAAIGLEVDGARFGAVGQKVYAARSDRTTAVHYTRITLSPEATASMRAGTAKVAIVIAHARYEARAELSPAGVKRLAEDLA